MPLASVIAEVTALPMRGHLIKRQQASSLHKGAFVGRRPVQRAHVRRKFYGTTCDFNQMLLWNVLIRQFAADPCV